MTTTVTTTVLEPTRCWTPLSGCKWISNSSTACNDSSDHKNTACDDSKCSNNGTVAYQVLDALEGVQVDLQRGAAAPLEHLLQDSLLQSRGRGGKKERKKKERGMQRKFGTLLQTQTGHCTLVLNNTSRYTLASIPAGVPWLVYPQVPLADHGSPEQGTPPAEGYCTVQYSMNCTTYCTVHSTVYSAVCCIKHSPAQPQGQENRHS